MPNNSTLIRACLITLACISSFLIFLLSNNFRYLKSFPTGETRHGSYGTGNKGAGEFLVGAGRADITGPVVEINMMGFADMNQVGTGLRQRLYCRAVIAGSLENRHERIAYLVLDTQAGDTAVRHGIIEGLKELGPEYEIYTKHNGAAVAVTGTHSHSGPGAWLNYLLPQITSKGFDKNSYQAIVDGCVLAVKRAHENLGPGHLHLGTGQVRDSNVNRSPYAYLANPKEERAKYSTDVDKDLTVLSLTYSNGTRAAILTWFPVHGTSLYQNNTLITGDNKGVAAYLVEESFKSENLNFVAGFSQSNVGDTSPNVLGAFCQDTGLACRFNDSTCGGRTQGCHGRGPFFQYQDQGTRSCFEIGRRQYLATMEVLRSGMTKIPSSQIGSFHTFQDLSNFTFVSPFDPSEELRTCSAALGYGFAGGTTDGPGAFDFTQGNNDTNDSPSDNNPVWKVARAFLHQPSNEQIQCQSPKPILLDVGAASRPYAWSPNIVDIQVLRIGPLIMIIAPGEATTMSGRRWRNAISRASTALLGLENPHVVIGGPANTYAHYIATAEEYAIQRYEGASTLYGPNTLAAYINLTVTYLPHLGSAKDSGRLKPLPIGPQPPININASYGFNRGVVFDSAGLFHQFGEETKAVPADDIHVPGTVVESAFVGANPRNNFRLEGTFAAIEMFSPEHNGWVQVRDDRDWALVYNWRRTSTALGTSEVTIQWEIEQRTQPGLYRMKYFGDAKSVTGTITPFEGTGTPFRVGSSDNRKTDELKE